MNNWLNKLERKYGRFGIPNLTNILVAGQILVFAIELFIDRTITAWVGLNRFFLLQGQIWRAITFVFIPFSGGSILSVVLGIYFTWFVGTALEKEWGDFRYTLYFLLGMVGGMVIGLFHGILSVRYKVNQVISGIGLNLLALAVTTLLMQLIWNNKGSTPQVASISTTLDFFAPIPVIGPILAQQSVSFLVMVAAVVVGWIVLFKTRFGLRLRMVGENPKAAATMGLRVHGIKYCGVLICGALAGVGGAYLSLDQLDMFVRNMTAGRGYIAVAIAILGRYNPAQIVPCALLFGFCDAVQIYLQGEAFPPQIVQMLPYIVTLLVLAFGVKHIKPPAGVGKYDDE